MHLVGFIIRIYTTLFRMFNVFYFYTIIIIIIIIIITIIIGNVFDSPFRISLEERRLEPTKSALYFMSTYRPEYFPQ